MQRQLQIPDQITHTHATKPMLLTLVLLLASCQGQDRTKEFPAFCGTLPVIQLPITLECGLAVRPESNRWGADSLTFERFGLSSLVAGRLYPDEPFLTLLCGEDGDVMLASAYTYTREGKVIDSVMIGGECFADLGYSSRSVAYLSVDRKIVICDTSWTVKYDLDQDDEIPGSDSTHVRYRQYQLLTSGKFVSLKDSAFSCSGTLKRE